MIWILFGNIWRVEEDKRRSVFRVGICWFWNSVCDIHETRSQPKLGNDMAIVGIFVPNSCFGTWVRAKHGAACVWFEPDVFGKKLKIYLFLLSEPWLKCGWVGCCCSSASKSHIHGPWVRIGSFACCKMINVWLFVNWISFLLLNNDLSLQSCWRENASSSTIVLNRISTVKSPPNQKGKMNSKWKLSPTRLQAIIDVWHPCWSNRKIIKICFWIIITVIVIAIVFPPLEWKKTNQFPPLLQDPSSERGASSFTSKNSQVANWQCLEAAGKTLWSTPEQWKTGLNYLFARRNLCSMKKEGRKSDSKDAGGAPWFHPRGFFSYCDRFSWMSSVNRNNRVDWFNLLCKNLFRVLNILQKKTVESWFGIIAIIIRKQTDVVHG